MSEQDNSEVALEDKMFVIWLRQSAEKTRQIESDRAEKFKRDQYIFMAAQYGGFIGLLFWVGAWAFIWLALTFYFAHRHSKANPGLKHGPDELYTPHEMDLLDLDAMSDRKLIEAIRSGSYSEVRRQFELIGKY